MAIEQQDGEGDSGVSLLPRNERMAKKSIGIVNLPVMVVGRSRQKGGNYNLSFTPQRLK
jgi:hypothetical protein